MRTRVSVGTLSMLLVFAVMSMAIFCILAFGQGKSDEEMAKENAEAVKTYYQADSKGEDFVGEVDQIFREADSIKSQEEWKRQVTEKLEEKYQVRENGVSADIPVREGQVLRVELDTDWEERSFCVHSWRVLEEEEETKEEPMGVWEGGR